MSKLPSGEQMLARLVAEPSASSADPAHDQPNRGAIERIAEWCESVGMRTELTRVGNHDDKLNLIATLDPTTSDGAPGLVLAGHADTVPCEPSLWRADPYVVREESGALVGLGAADMKGFFGCALLAIEAVRDARRTRAVTLIATADEESSMLGARVIAERVVFGDLGTRAIIGEPTGLVPITKHKGVTSVEIVVEGESGHASEPRLGRNAIDGMMIALAAAHAWQRDLAARYTDTAFVEPAATISVGKIAGGDSSNRICGLCTALVDLRVLPGMELADLRQSLERTVRDAVGAAYVVRVTASGGGTAAYEIEPGNEFASAMEHICSRSRTAVMFGTEAGWFQRAGLQSVICGPGGITEAHRPNEFVTRTQLYEATEMYQRALVRYCVTDGA